MLDLRWMVSRDLPQVLQIERDSFQFPWTERDFLQALKQPNVLGMVAVDRNGEVRGYAIRENHDARIHLLSMAVAPQHRRTGVGRQLVQVLIDRVQAGNRRRVILEVREGNLGAQLFFRANGFLCVAVLKDFYDDTAEDAYLMHYKKPQEQESKHDCSSRAAE